MWLLVPASTAPVPAGKTSGVHERSSPSYTVNVPVLTVKNTGPGCVCQPLYPPGWNVTTCVATSIGAVASSSSFQVLSFLSPSSCFPFTLSSVCTRNLRVTSHSGTVARSIGVDTMPDGGVAPATNGTAQMNPATARAPAIVCTSFIRPPFGNQVSCERTSLDAGLND